MGRVAGGRVAVMVGAVLMAAGCTVIHGVNGTEWTKTGSSMTEQTLDEIDCLRAASDAGETYDMVMGGLFDLGRYVVGERLRTQDYRRCMASRGYRSTAAVR